MHIPILGFTECNVLQQEILKFFTLFSSASKVLLKIIAPLGLQLANLIKEENVLIVKIVFLLPPPPGEVVVSAFGSLSDEKKLFEVINNQSS